MCRPAGVRVLQDERFAITALWPESRRSSPNVKAFIAFLIELFPSTPPWDEVINQVVDARQEKGILTVSE
jgi:hypothetical protein